MHLFGSDKDKVYAHGIAEQEEYTLYCITYIWIYIQSNNKLCSFSCAGWIKNKKPKIWGILKKRHTIITLISYTNKCAVNLIQLIRTIHSKVWRSNSGHHQKMCLSHIYQTTVSKVILFLNLPFTCILRFHHNIFYHLK